jgi:hypothetical protein
MVQVEYMLITSCLVHVGAWLLHLFIVHVEVQVDAWFGLLYRLFGAV